MNDLTIDNEFKDLLPPLSEEQKEELEKDIIKNGCINSLTVWKNILIDGHHRHEICTRNNIQFDIVEMEFKDRLEAMEWIWMNQKNRRNLTKYELAQIALKFKPVIEAKAKENQLSTLKQNTVLTKSSKREDERKESVEENTNLVDSDGNQPIDGQIDFTEINEEKVKKVEPINTRKEIAKIAGVSEDTIHKVEVIEEKAPEEIKQQVKKGDITINSAYVLTKSAIEADKKNAEYEKEYQEQLEKEQQENEEKKKLEEIQKNLPENAVVLDKFRKPKEAHIFGIEDFNNLTMDQFNDCIKHSKKYRDAISKVALLSTDIEALMAWGAIANTPDIVEIELQDINSAIQNLIKIQNYFKGGK
ncbi:hypothetical protein [Clostridium beijerinckii]|uniref:hypothetical protein n=1 Tax=Clostridium beijerinckii TaxID=1520 RepID=UPI00098C8593|nr:hypothetical protein [Clostridium beijerinckii]MBA8937304.1 ParB-like chromosome segregation protein Spo0J [Clostridium beijerinckii]NRU40230.1 ParB-like chromosome segregation protein Spo0J [Clostridium beijerinckii]NSA96493.1 ParB-like chromosome segregation protein Spo0J [Clostridium beijerinckii]OOM64571.1 hypothetical protein CLBEIC_54920 [Clostridium beijerinckii]CUU47026.1 conserved protein of unknown function [Clostridium beijerinckii]